jgi:hypothetical protein
LIVITIQSGEIEGQVDISVKSEPTLPVNEPQEVDAAQGTAIAMINAVTENTTESEVRK